MRLQPNPSEVVHCSTPLCILYNNRMLLMYIINISFVFTVFSLDRIRAKIILNFSKPNNSNGFHNITFPALLVLLKSCRGAYLDLIYWLWDILQIFGIYYFKSSISSILSQLHQSILVFSTLAKTKNTF